MSFLNHVRLRLWYLRHHFRRNDLREFTSRK